MTEVSDGPSTLAEHGMKLPVNGARYRSPLAVAGTSPFEIGHQKIGKTELEFHQAGQILANSHSYRFDAEFSYIQELSPGPCELKVRHLWNWLTAPGGDKTDLLSVGGFYVLTPPRSDPPAAE